MKRYNDYENIVYGYLNNYTQFLAKSQNIQLEIELLYDEIKELTNSSNITVTRYDKVISGTTNNNSSVEQSAELKIKIEEKIKILQADKKQIDTLLARINNVLNSLKIVDKTIVTERFINGMYWKDISQKVGYSERSCQRIATESLSKIAKNLFSKTAYVQGKLNFIFVDN